MLERSPKPCSNYSGPCCTLPIEHRGIGAWSLGDSMSTSEWHSLGTVRGIELKVDGSLLATSLGPQTSDDPCFLELHYILYFVILCLILENSIPLHYII